MPMKSLFKKSLGFASVASLGVTVVAPFAQAQEMPNAPLLLAQVVDCASVTTDASAFAPPTAMNIMYSLACDDLSYGGHICLNNPSEECGGSPYEVGDDHTIPDPDYDVETPSGHACVNNVNPACGNPRHYGVFYGEMPTDFSTSRTDAVFAQLGQSSAADVTLPPRTSVAPAPSPAPIQGLW